MSASLAPPPAVTIPKRVGVVGSCQTPGLCDTLRALLPGTEIWGSHYGVTPETREEIRDRMAESDAVIVQIADYRREFGVRSDQPTPPITLLPTLVFNGFQPDCVYVHDHASLTHSPLGEMHSAIAVAGFLLGLPVARTCALFNAHVYAALGYFDAYKESCSYLTKTYGSAGYDLGGEIATWVAQGPFMYTLNHPAIRVIATLGTMAARKLGLVGPSTPPPGIDFDALSGHLVWPTYPEIARRIGTRPSDMVWLVGAGHGQPPQRWDVERVVSESYALYATLPRDRLDIGVAAQTRAVLAALLA